MQGCERAGDVDRQVDAGINHTAAAIVQRNAREIGGEISVLSLQLWLPPRCYGSAPPPLRLCYDLTCSKPL